MENNHYYVLFTRTIEQERLKLALEDVFPKRRGTVFLPGMEWWRRGKNTVELKRLYPGYVFIRSDMSPYEIHEFVRRRWTHVGAFVRELGAYEKRLSGEDAFADGADGDKDGCEWGDLTRDETEFFDCVFDENGIIKMSVGYGEGGGYVVMDGPLKSFERRIVDVDRHNRVAYLDFKVRGRIAKAGMQLLPKTHWFPKDRDAPLALEDGTEVNLLELGKRMMGG